MQKLRPLLWPFSVLYDGITRLRNFAFDRGWFPSEKFVTTVWTIGNLSTGGTGKTPMTEYLLSRFQSEYRIAVLSRGYGRKTQGFHWVQPEGTVAEYGDEPLQMKRKFPDLPVAVDADRRRGIKKIIAELPNVDLIILDDAFQHRYVRPSLAILLTAFGDLYVDDHLLPAGNLRESRLGTKRADVVVVTKCPKELTETSKKEIEKKLGLQIGKNLFFSTLYYTDTVQSASKKMTVHDLVKKDFTLVTGIANPKTLNEFLRAKGAQFEHLSFNDHHFFTDKEISQLNEKTLLLTTEKDYTRLKGRIEKPLYYLAIEMVFVADENNFLTLMRSSLPT